MKGELNVIEKQQIFPMLLAACPSYVNRYEAYIAKNYEPEEERLLYVDICDFTAYIIECDQHQKTDEFNDVFELVEQMLVHGDYYVKDFATVGILETLQNQLLDKKIELGEFEKRLYPESKLCWNQIIDFWSGKD